MFMNVEQAYWFYILSCIARGATSVVAGAPHATNEFIQFWGRGHGSVSDTPRKIIELVQLVPTIQYTSPFCLFRFLQQRLSNMYTGIKICLQFTLGQERMELKPFYKNVLVFPVCKMSQKFYCACSFIRPTDKLTYSFYIHILFIVCHLYDWISPQSRHGSLLI